MIPKLHPIAAQVRALDARYWSLHLKCADGTATADDLAELDAMEAAKINSLGNPAEDSGVGVTPAPTPGGFR